MKHSDPILNKQVQRLYQLNLCRRWLFMILCWLTLGSFSLCKLWGEFKLWHEHFTWVALRYGLAFNLLPAFSLFLCTAVTGSVLTWHSSHIIRGLSPRQKVRLKNQLKKIQQLKPNHPLRKWICSRVK
ncbi:MAG: hypothetical protein KPI85_03855 [cyanobacterium endosymbiont of Epithemia adnata isolate EadnSB Bon19]|jgi:hypothetical protein